MNDRISQALSAIRRRVVGLGVAGGIGWGMAAALLALMGWMWLDLALDLPGPMRAAAAGASIFAGIGLLGYWVALALRDSAMQSLARRLDAVGATRGQILAGVDLAQGRPQEGISQGLAIMAVDRAQELIGKVPAGLAAPASALRWPWGGAGAVMACAGLVMLLAPRLAGTQWARFTDPFGDHPPYSRVQLEVEPGDVQVVYGRGFDIRIVARGGLVERAEVVLGGGEDVLPMFGESGGTWRATVASVTAPARYFVRAPGSVSRKFQINVITVPRLEGVRVRVTPPAYTNRPPYEGAVPQGGLFGLPGTKVELFATSNRPLSGGMIDVEGVGAVKMMGAGNEAAGWFLIQKNGKVTLRVIDSAGQASTESFSAPITLLKDERPFVRVVQPLPNSFATPSTMLPVELIAEDDYGLSRVAVYRSLNDSRPLALELPLPRPAPTRFPGGTQLPLAKYGLKPGDVIKVFARVEDNDPAGAKGSESSISIVRIISEEEYRKMMMAREGMEVLQSKYAQAQRRMEALAEEIRKLEEELAKKEKNGQIDEAMRKKLEELAKKLEEEAKAVAESAKEKLPFDLDKKLTRELEKAAKDLEEMAKQAAELAKREGLTVGGASKALEELARRLAGRQGDFNAGAMEPLEHLAKIFPLIEDQARFIIIYEQQKDIAERLSAMKDKERAEDPKDKARMRDLEEAQRKLRDELRDLLDDIEQHLQQLPDDPKLDDLRETAADFTRKVRESQADDCMRDAADGLAEFNGKKGYDNAKSAEETLSQFIKRAQAVAGMARGCVVFQPSLVDGIGDTIDQLLDAEGLGGAGVGGGGGGGFAAKRSSLRNVGVYGNLARLAQQARSGGSSEKGVTTDGRGNTASAGKPTNVDGAGQGTSAGSSEGAVPVNYRRRVGDYFRRVADEIGK